MPLESVTVVSPFPPEQGGIAQSSDRIVDTMKPHRKVLQHGWRSHYPSLLYRGEQMKANGTESDITRILTWYNPFSWIRVGLQSRKSQRVCFAWATAFDAIPYRVIAKVSGRPVSVLVHNVHGHQRLPLETPLTRFFFRTADVLVTHTNEVESDIRRLMPQANTVVAPHPPNLNVERTTPSESKPFRLLQAGLVRKYKGADIAIEALAVAVGTGLDAHLRIVGQFWDVQKHDLEDLAELLGVSDRVSIEDLYLEDEDLLSEIQQSNAVLVPYRSGTQSGIIPLALAAGRPVVATPVGGLPEQIASGVDGIVAENSSPDAVGVAIVELAASYDALVRSAGINQPTWSDVAAAMMSSQ